MVTIMEISSVSANAVMVHEFEYTDDVISTTVGYVDGSSSRISLLTTAPASDVSVTLSLSTTATSLVDQMSYLVDNQSSTCDFCVFSALPLPVPNNVRNGFVASGNASLTPTVSGDVTTFHLALSTAIALTVGALFAIFAVYETFRLMLGIAIRRKRQEGGLLTISVHLLLALFSVSDVAVCLAAVSCRPALRLSHCILLSTLSDLILPVMASSFALQTSLVVRRRRRRSLATTASVGDVSNFRYDCYPNVIVQPHQMGLIVAAAFFVYVILTCGTGFVDVLHENGIIENDTIQLLPVQIVIRAVSLCISMILYIHYLINDIFVSRQILTAGESRSSPSSTSPELTEVAMLLAAILGVTYISLRTNDVINSTIAGARASGCDRLCLNSRGSASWVVASWAIERTVELAFAVAMETATFPRSTRSPSRTCSSYRNPPTMTETSCVVRMAMHDLSGARRRARLDLLFPWRRIGKRLKSAWWQRRTGGTSHIRLEQSSTSELNPERHRGRSGQTASGWWQHSASDALTSDNTAEQLPALGNHHYWIDWQPMTTHRPSRAGNRQSALSNVEPSSSNSGSVQRYMSIDDNDDEDDGGDEATEKENREHGRQRRPLSQLLVNDGGFIRFRENGDPDGLPISVSSADEDDDLNRKSDSEYETQIDANSNSGDRKSGWRLFGRSPKIPMFAGRQSNSVHSVTGLHSHRTDISTSKSYPVTYESLQESVRQTRSGYQLSPSTPKKTRACVVGDDVILEFAIPSMDLGDSIDRALHHCGTNPDD